MQGRHLVNLMVEAGFRDVKSDYGSLPCCWGGYIGKLMYEVITETDSLFLLSYTFNRTYSSSFDIWDPASIPLWVQKVILTKDVMKHYQIKHLMNVLNTKLLSTFVGRLVEKQWFLLFNQIEQTCFLFVNKRFLPFLFRGDANPTPSGNLYIAYRDLGTCSHTPFDFLLKQVPS